MDNATIWAFFVRVTPEVTEVTPEVTPFLKGCYLYKPLYIKALYIYGNTGNTLFYYKSLYIYK